MLERVKRNEIKLNMSMNMSAKMSMSVRIANKLEANVFTYKDIGQTIQKLVSNFYQHKFTKLPFERISNEQAIKILMDTVIFTFSHYYFLIFYALYFMKYFFITPLSPLSPIRTNMEK
jgi:hypothetical protein